MLDLQRLHTKLAGYGIELDVEKLQRLDRYAGLLVETNQHINLTAITEPEQVEDKHMLDCLLLAAQPELQGTYSLVDVGTGAGFPGLVLKVFNPELSLTLMEPTGKRCNFLAGVAGELGLDVQILKERAEEAARKQWRESFDIAVARAVANLPALCEYCLPLVKPGGRFIAMKADVEEELEAAHNAIQKLGGEYMETRHYNLPDGSARALVFIRKKASTAKQYPRSGARIAKQPL